jgi:hypothetical protein
MRFCFTSLAIAIAGVASAAEGPNAKRLSELEIRDGWISLFDGETSFGWKTDGDVSIKDGTLIVGGGEHAGAIETTGAFGGGTVGIKSKPGEFLGKASATWRSIKQPMGGVTTLALKSGSAPGSIRISCPAGTKLEIESVTYKPSGLDAIFNGKDLAGWKRFAANEKQAKSQFTVTPEGWINVKNGPGDLQTEKQWADFVFQGECISNGKALNSGVFFRCIPGQYQNGYEYQIHNGFKNNDRTKPADFGTGAIYRRIPARKVVPNDHEWFTMTLIAHGRHISTWVNGYQTVDWTDERKENENPRNGCKLGAGPISLQGHDPTTDLSFRNLRIAELKKE